MSRYIKYQGKLVKFADKLLKMAEYIYNEGIHYLRVLAGGGEVTNRTLTEDYYKMAEENSMLDNIRLAIFPESGYNKRESGIYDYATKVYSLIPLSPAARKNLATYSEQFDLWSIKTLLTVTPNAALSPIGTETADLLVTTGASVIYSSYTFAAGQQLTISVWIKSANANVNKCRLLGDQNQVSPDITATDEWVRHSFTITTNRSTDSAYGITRTELNTPFSVYVWGFQIETGASATSYQSISDAATWSGGATDIVQATANNQPYLFKKGIKNPNGGVRFMTHPTVSFADGVDFTISILVKPFNTVAFNYVAGTASSFFYDLIRISNGDFSIAIGNATTNTTVSIAGANRYNDKNVHITYTVQNREVKIYVNGQLVKTQTVTNSTFATSRFINDMGSRHFIGNGYAYIVRSGALTPTQVTAEYNLLRSYFPEMETVEVSGTEIAIENYESVVTPMGRVINLNNTAGNVERVVNGGFDADTNWVKNTGVSIGGGVCTFTNVAVSEGVTQGNAIAGKLYKHTYKVLSITNGSVRARVGGVSGIIRTSAGTYTEYIQATTPSAFGVLTSSSSTTAQIDNISCEECGWNDAENAYNGLISQGSTVSNALAAAAMWRSPDSDHDKQAVFGKLFNGYAAQLLQMDIDAYNAANPSTPWGYHVATLQDFQAIKDTLGGVETAGKKIKINGTDYWTSDNGDNTSGAEVLGSGYIDENGEYQDYKEATGFWTVTENGDMLEVVTLRDELNELFITE